MTTKVTSPWKLSIGERLRQVNPVVCLLIICFAFSSWIDMYGVWVELPILVKRLPEGWSLPSYLVIIVECCMVIPFIYVIITRYYPGKRRMREMITTYIIMTVGATACVLMAFFWHKTVTIAGVERSVALLSLCAFLCVVDTVSTVVYYPYMDRFKPHYLPYFVAGEEVGGMLSGFAGMAQGVGGEIICLNKSRLVVASVNGTNYTEFYTNIIQPEPRFSVSAFFLFLGAMLCTSILAFSLLNFTSFAKREMISEEENAYENEKLNHLPDARTHNGVTVDDKGAIALRSDTQPMTNINTPCLNGSMTNHNTSSLNDQKEAGTCIDKTEDGIQPNRIKGRGYFLLFLSTISSFMVFGLEPSIQSFACLPYGSAAYTLAIRLCTILNPIAALTAFIIPTRSLRVIVTWVSLATGVVIYHIILALESPTPPLQDHVMGPILVVALTVFMTTAYVYARANMAAIMRLEGGPNGTLYAGMCLQLGAFLGGITGFLLVNVFNLFQSIAPCPL